MNNNLQKARSSSLQAYMNTPISLTELRSLALNPSLYNTRITRKNPAAIVFLIDQSGSMSDEFNESTKAVEVAKVINRFLSLLKKKCSREGNPRDYFHLLIIGYGQQVGNQAIAKICWEGNLSHKEWVTISDLHNNHLEEIVNEVPNTKKFGDRIVKMFEWTFINPYAESLTPMKAAFELCLEKLEDWSSDRQNSYPPLVINITDGQPTDVIEFDELILVADKIKGISTANGNTLIFNCLLTDNENKIVFPSYVDEIETDDDYHRLLFNISSPIPKKMKEYAYQKMGNSNYLTESPVGVILNSDIKTLIDLIDIGTLTNINNAGDED